VSSELSFAITGSFQNERKTKRANYVAVAELSFVITASFRIMMLRVAGNGGREDGKREGEWRGSSRVSRREA